MAANFWDTQEVITEIEKNKKEKVVVSKCTRQGKEYIDYRIYADKDGQFVPTAKGYNLEINKAIELSVAVDNIINK